MDFNILQNGLVFWNNEMQTTLGWRLAVASARKDNLALITPDDMRSCGWETGPDGLVIEWTGNSLAGPNFKVRTIWRIINDIWSGSIEYAGNESAYEIEEMIFPCLQARLYPDAYFLSTSNQGFMEPCRNSNRKRRFFSGMQFAAYLTDRASGNNLYLDCRDSRQHVKMYDWRITSDNRFFEYESIYFPPLNKNFRQSHKLPYECTVCSFSGSWFEASQIYKPWARRQDWFLNRRNSDRMRDIGMWVWNRGQIADVVPPVKKLQEESGVPVALDWYWWHHNPYDTDYPDFWPPREGEKSFKQAVAELNEDHIFTQVYINGMTWDIDGDTYIPEHGCGSILINRDGSEKSTMFNQYTRHRLGWMCGEAPQFQHKMQILCKTLADSGLPGIYLDMIGGSGFGPCYNPAHRHPQGGGTAQIEDYRSYVAAIRENNPGILLSTEYACEMMDQFDSMIVLASSCERMSPSDGLPVPAFSAVYHGGMTMFGNYALPDSIPPWDPLWPQQDRWRNERDWQKLYPLQFFFEMARTLIWGMQPCVCNLQMKHLEEKQFVKEYEFIRETARFYYDNRNFLYDGVMLHPGDLKCDSIPVSFSGRGIFTKENDFRDCVHEYPALLHSVWQSPDGTPALFLANYTNEKRAYQFGGISGEAAPRSYTKVLP